MLRQRLHAEHIRLRAFYLPLVIFCLTLLTAIHAFHMYRYSGWWLGYEAAGGNALLFCERNHMNEIIRQPANTWSNFGYLAVGLLALTFAIHDYRNSTRRNSGNFLVRYPMFSLLYGLSCLYLFAGSFLYHASLTGYFQRLDQSGMISVVVMILAMNAYKILPYMKREKAWRHLHTATLLSAILVNALIFNFLLKVNINLLFPVLVTLVAGSALFYVLHIRNRSFFLNYMYVAFLLMFLAGAIWMMDRTHTLCNPGSVLQGHALWHLLTACSLFFIYLYYRSGSTPILPMK